MSFKPIPLTPQSTRRLSLLAFGLIIIAIVSFLLLRYLYSPSGRWAKYQAQRLDPEALAEFTIYPGQRCDDAPFAFPTTGVVLGLWDQSYRLGHHHQGLDIFAGTEPGVTPVYAAYPGYLSRLPDWKASVIIRLPDDPLNPGRQIWTYYTHMATAEGENFIVPDFPPGTEEMFVEAGTLLGYQGDYSGDRDNPTGLHLHFSIVQDDGSGTFLNELDIDNTLDPSPYFNMPLNHNDNPNDFPICLGRVTQADWDLAESP